MLLFAIWKRREINGGIFLPPAACIISSWISAHEGEKTDNVFTECLQCGKALLQWQQTNKNTHGHTHGHTQKQTLHGVLCAKPLLPEGTLALMFWWQQHQVGFLRGEERQGCTDHLNTHTHARTHTHTHTHTHTNKVNFSAQRRRVVFFPPLF